MPDARSPPARQMSARTDIAILNDIFWGFF